MEEFLKDVFVENLLFTIFKDKPSLSSESKRTLLKSKFPQIDISKLYRQIISYQIKKYGVTLCKDKGKGLTVWIEEFV